MAFHRRIIIKYTYILAYSFVIKYIRIIAKLCAIDLSNLELHRLVNPCTISLALGFELNMYQQAKYTMIAILKTQILSISVSSRRLKHVQAL